MALWFRFKLDLMAGKSVPAILPLTTSEAKPKNTNVADSLRTKMACEGSGQDTDVAVIGQFVFISSFVLLMTGSDYMISMQSCMR